jgi:hypothetical protein
LLFVLHWLLPFCRVSQSFALLRWWVRQLLRAVRRWFAPCAMATKITWFPTALNQATKRQLISATESMALAAVCHSCTLTLQHSDNRCVSRAGNASTTMRDGHQNHWLPTALNQATKRQLISATESTALAAVCHSCTLTLQHSDNRCVSRAGNAPTTMRDGHQNHWLPTALNQATKRQLISATESMALAAVCHSCTLTLQHSDNRCVSRAGTAPTTMRDGHHQNHLVSDSAQLALCATTQCLSALPVSSHFRCVFVGYRLAFRPRSTRSVRQRA